MRGGVFLSVSEASKATGMREDFLRRMLRDGVSFGTARRNMNGRRMYLIFPLEFKTWCENRGITCKVDLTYSER